MDAKERDRIERVLPVDEYPDFIDRKAKHIRHMLLMNSAPDMLECLRECYALLDDYSDVLDGDDGQPRPNKAMSMMTEIERVIRKAGAEL